VAVQYPATSSPSEYDRVTAPALAEYVRVRAQAWAEYDRVRAQAVRAALLAWGAIP
jgi:hypothetical protein